MKKKTKYVLFLNWLLFPLALIGCANVSYIRYTDGTLTEKEPNAPFVLYAEAPNDVQYTVIGSLTVEGGSGILTQMSITEIQKRFVKEALKRGADGAINVAIYSYNTPRGLTTPGYTEYETTTSYHSGNIYGDIQGHYSGTSFSKIPIYHPPHTTYYDVQVNLIKGELILFNPGTTFGESKPPPEQ